MTYEKPHSLIDRLFMLLRMVRKKLYIIANDFGSLFRLALENVYAASVVINFELSFCTIHTFNSSEQLKVTPKTDKPQTKNPKPQTPN